MERKEEEDGIGRLVRNGMLVDLMPPALSSSWGRCLSSACPAALGRRVQWGTSPCFSV
jgi:hypothetical protein